MKKTFLALSLSLAMGFSSFSYAEKLSNIEFANTVEMGDIKQVKTWIENGIPTSFEGSRIGHGLHIATWTNNLDMMKLFVHYGADVNQVNQFGETPLTLAAFRGNREAIEYLISQGAQINVENNKYSPLHYASFGGHNDIINYLINNGANLNAKSPNGSTPLMMAVYEGQIESMQILLNAGADPNIANERGERAFEWAMRKNNLTMAEKLTDKENFIAAANAPKNTYKPLQTSFAPSPTLNRLLSLKEQLIKKGSNEKKLEEINAQIDSEKHRIVDAIFARNEATKVNSIQIQASRNNPDKQKVFIVTDY